ncbi:MAG TPA: hypothetical protein PK366_07780, partial [Fibrobacteraceae bacterium]|nr:hypothetical protein [Fibrobacteraceae bacterium]
FHKEILYTTKKEVKKLEKTDLYKTLEHYAFVNFYKKKTKLVPIIKEIMNYRLRKAYKTLYQHPVFLQFT